MFLLTPSTTEQYLRDRGELDANETVRVSELAGGVSNQVLLVERSRGDRFVLKQAREQLRVEQEWKCDVRRIWREMDVLRLCKNLWAMGRDSASGVESSVPEIVFEDRENYCYAMWAAPEEHLTWKQQLLSGIVDLDIADAAGRLLGNLHAMNWLDPHVASLLDDRSYFDALRVAPYYRRVAEVHPDLRAEIERLINTVWSHRCCLVHGDFSPKNLLLFDRRLMLIDFEVGHFGDPAFDTGFCLTHLVLKSLWAGPRRSDYIEAVRRFWSSYSDTLRRQLDNPTWIGLEERTIYNLAGCMLARIDGKSPVDYLSEESRQHARRLAIQLFRSPPELLRDVIRIIE